MREEGRCKATWKRGFQLLWREAGPSKYHDGQVDLDQKVVDKEPSLCEEEGLLDNIGCSRKRFGIEIMTSDRKLKASREGSK
jgi:hypothetical protein